MNSRLTVRPEITAIQGENRYQLENCIVIREAIAGYFNTIYLPLSEKEIPEMEKNYRHPNMSYHYNPRNGKRETRQIKCE